MKKLYLLVFNKPETCRRLRKGLQILMEGWVDGMNFGLMNWWFDVTDWGKDKKTESACQPIACLYRFISETKNGKGALFKYLVVPKNILILTRYSCWCWHYLNHWGRGGRGYCSPWTGHSTTLSQRVHTI